MTRVRKGLLTAVLVYVGIYIITVVFFVFTQDKFFFHPEKLNKDYKFSFPVKFEELNIMAADSTVLNGVIFKADSSKGLIFYLHGNGGCIKEFTNITGTFTELKYDFFVLDYRGFGKSEGEIKSESELYSDIQIAYDLMKSRYEERKIVVYGYSLGTGLAAKLASSNNPRMLIMQAPYYSWIDLFKHRCPVIPTSLVKYKIETYKYLTECRMPILMFHGDKDPVIYYQSSEKLKKLVKPGDNLFILAGMGHGVMIRNETYLRELKKALE
jgi:uncharacterized protein